MTISPAHFVLWFQVRFNTCDEQAPQSQESQRNPSAAGRFSDVTRLVNLSLLFIER